MEYVNQENVDLISRISSEVSQALGKHRPVTDEQYFIYCVNNLPQEVGSGASFEQYFRWARLEEIAMIVSQLESLGLSEAAEITREAISVAWPDGLPPIPDDKISLASWHGSEEQNARLTDLADKFLAEYDGMVMNRLADYARRVGV
jgi:hypothetical protein